MGYYINRPNESKEAFLEREGTPLQEAPERYEDVPSTEAIVCLVDNGMFTAAGVAYSSEELGVFKLPDGRPKQWYTISKEKITDNIPLEYFE